MKYLTALALSLLPVFQLLATDAQLVTQFDCTNRNDQKRVSLDYPGLDHLCEVSVTTAGGERDVKWYANHDSEFCSIKLNELVGKFRNLWGYRCEGQQRKSSLLELNLRHRKAVDTIIKDTTREGQEASIPFVVTAARAHATTLSDETLSALVVQVVMNAQDVNITKPIDRIYVIEDDGKQFRTRSVWSDLSNFLTLDEQRYKIDSAVINGITPEGEIAVATVLIPSAEQSSLAGGCTGNQTLTATEDGNLIPTSQHLINCE